MQAAEARCRQRGLTLSDRFEDRGVSAWNGKNQERALGDLLRIAKRGDYLLVEDADWLSRQDWLTAQNFVAGIAAKGVTIVTLNDNKEINAERLRLDPGFRG